MQEGLRKVKPKRPVDPVDPKQYLDLKIHEYSSIFGRLNLLEKIFKKQML